MENIELKESFIDGRTNIEYVRKGDYYIPNIVLAPESKNKEKKKMIKYLKK